MAPHPNYLKSDAVKEICKNFNVEKLVFASSSSVYGNSQKDKFSEAVYTMLEVIKLDRGWNDDAARKQLIKFFEAIGPTNPITVEGRKKLSSILFS